MSMAGIKPIPEQFTVRWKVEPHFADEFVSPGVTPANIENTVTLAQDLPNTKHTLEISGNDATPFSAIRIYRPALAAKRDTAGK
jgi:hypothetical protein